MFSILEMFKIGVGPSSSHTVGPMVAACKFVESLEHTGTLGRVSRVRTVLYGSLALTGLGHGTDRATVAGLEGNMPQTVDTDHVNIIRHECESSGELLLAGKHRIDFDYAHDGRWTCGIAWPRTLMACVSRHLTSRTILLMNRSGIPSVEASYGKAMPRI